MSVRLTTITSYRENNFNLEKFSEKDLKKFIEAEYQSEKETWEKNVVSFERLEDVVERKNLQVEALKA